MVKILVASPIYDGMEYCFNEFMKKLKEIDYYDFKILIMDNSRTKKFYRKIRKIPEIKVIYDETNEEDNLNRLISSRNKILDYAIMKNYDYILMMDSDVMVKPNIIKELVSKNKDVISGLYFNNLNFGGSLVRVPIAYAFVTEKEFQYLKERNELPKGAKCKEDIRRHLNNVEIRRNDILEVQIPSGGCLLLSRKAFTSGARYGLEKENTGGKTGDEILFFNTLRKFNFKLYCYPPILCEHEIKNKYDEGRRHLSN